MARNPFLHDGGGYTGVKDADTDLGIDDIGEQVDGQALEGIEADNEHSQHHHADADGVVNGPVGDAVDDASILIRQCVHTSFQRSCHSRALCSIFSLVWLISILKCMRLSSEEISRIKSIIFSVDTKADIFLYGSRVDDAKRGGDIDLLVISDLIDFNNKLDIAGELFEGLGEQKVDLLVERDFSKAFTRHIKETAIKL